MDKTIDKNYCMSSFLAFRYIANHNFTWREGIEPAAMQLIPEEDKIACKTSDDIDKNIREQLQGLVPEKTALLLSGGIDSGILAAYMPKGVRAYTVVNPNPSSDLEVKRAEQICKETGLEHIVVEVSWSDYQECIDKLMIHDGCPVFANEPQVYTVAKKIKEDGNEVIVLGDNADMAFGGMDRLLSKDWTYEEWAERYTFVSPETVLNDAASIMDVYERYKIGSNGVDFIKFINEIFASSSSGAYLNAFDCIGISYLDPYAQLKMADDLDLERVRAGDSKYLLRELYKKKFPVFEVPEKIAMVRAVDGWMKDWNGPQRPEFKPDCVKGLTGEQRFLIYSLERFLNLMDL